MVFVAFLFCDELTGDMVVEAIKAVGIESNALNVWQFIRAAVVLGVISTRLFTYRYEL